MNQVIMYIMAAGVLLGGIDRIIGKKWGYGRSMEEGFLLMGPTALSMVGMMCLIPFLSDVLGKVIIPFYGMIGVDPSMFAGMLAIDMGGYQLAKELAADPMIGRYAGIIVASTFGCTFIFTIPVGMSVVEKKDQTFFANGIMIGLVTLPVGLALGGLFCGMSLMNVLQQNIPIFLLAIFLIIGLKKVPNTMITGFERFASGIQILITFGLVCGAVYYMTNFAILPEIYPIEEALEVVASIGIVMLGSMPMALLLQRVLRKPFSWIGNKIGINEQSVAGLLIGTVSVLPQLAMIKEMDETGKVINAAYVVCAASMFAAHCGFTLSTEPDLLGALIVSKMTGGGAAIIAAVIFQKKHLIVSAE